MSDRRSELSTVLRTVLGLPNVYFQPPESVKMQYPAIVYALDGIKTVHADDGVYLSHRRYSVTIIDKNPDSILVEKMLALPYCSFNRHYTSDHLNHFVFTLYF
ncbi:MAG: hypothetical protein II828_01090 [Clostridia bacterium]|nr:hypothetical protein [Clostridia bacterium]